MTHESLVSLTLVRVAVCTCRDFWPPAVDTPVTQVLHSQPWREREKEKETTGTTVLYHLSHIPLFLLPPSACFRRKTAQGWLCAPHITTACASCTLLHGESTHSHTHNCCILCESYRTVTYGGMLVSSPHPPPYREKAAPHRSERRHFVTPSADEHVLIHWCGLFETLVLVFPFSPSFPPSFVSIQHILTPEEKNIIH